MQAMKLVPMHANDVMSTSLPDGGRCSSEDTSWQLYQLVNRRFAETIARIYQPNDIGAFACWRTLQTRQCTGLSPRSYRS